MTGIMMAVAGGTGSSAPTPPPPTYTVTASPSSLSRNAAGSSFSIGSTSFSTNAGGATSYSMTRQPGSDARISGSLSGAGASFSVNGINVQEAVNATFVVTATNEPTGRTASTSVGVSAFRTS